MEMFTDLFRISHHFDQFVREILRVGGHETDPLQSVDLFDLFQKPGKRHRLLKRFSIGIYILAQEHDFHHAILHQTLNLPDDRFRIPAPLTSADIGNDAVTAEVVASEHDIYARFKGILPLHRKILHDLVCILPDIDDHPVRFQTGGQKLRKFVDVMCTEDQIHETVTLLQLLYYMGFLHHTSAQTDHHIRILLFCSSKLSETPVNSLVCVLPYCACVINDEVGFSLLRFLHISHLLQDADKFFRVPGIHLASEGGNAESERTPCLCGQLRKIPSGLFNKIVLSLWFLCRNQYLIYCSFFCLVNLIFYLLFFHSNYPHFYVYYIN